MTTRMIQQQEWHNIVILQPRMLRMDDGPREDEAPKKNEEDEEKTLDGRRTTARRVTVERPQKKSKDRRDGEGTMTLKQRCARDQGGG